MAEVITRDNVILKRLEILRSLPDDAELWALGVIADAQGNNPRPIHVQVPLTAGETTALNGLTIKALNRVKMLEGIP